MHHFNSLEHFCTRLACTPLFSFCGGPLWKERTIQEHNRIRSTAICPPQEKLKTFAPKIVTQHHAFPRTPKRTAVWCLQWLSDTADSCPARIRPEKHAIGSWISHLNRVNYIENAHRECSAQWFHLVAEEKGLSWLDTRVPPSCTTSTQVLLAYTGRIGCK